MNEMTPNQTAGIGHNSGDENRFTAPDPDAFTVQIAEDFQEEISALEEAIEQVDSVLGDEEDIRGTDLDEAKDLIDHTKMTRVAVQELEKSVKAKKAAWTDAAKAYDKIFKPLFERADKAMERCRATVAAYAEANGGEPIKTAHGHQIVRAKASKSKLIIDDAASLPNAFLKQIPDEDAIKAALESGTEIPGARLVRPENWSIR